jgi:3-hydroxyacyl-[acyl-carrier-protein] dehydratase
MHQAIYQIGGVESNSGTLRAEIKINAAHPLFGGHFPDSPVTPGVIQLQMVKDILSQWLGRPLKLKAIRTCKFLEVLNPHQHEAIMISIKIKGNDVLEVSAFGESGNSVFFKLQATYI